MGRNDVIRAIYEAIQRANELREPDDQLVCAEETCVYGPGGLDSLGLVSLILDVEEAINAQAGLHMVLADERAMAQQRSPFRDVQSLANHIMARITEARACPSVLRS